MSELTPHLVRTYEALAETLMSPSHWWQVGVLIVSALIAWYLARNASRYARGLLASSPGTAVEIAASLLARATFPAVLGALCLIASAILNWIGLPSAVVMTASVLALSLAIIRLLIEALKRILRPGPLLVASEHLISWFVWVVVALYLLGWIEPVRAALNAIALPLGATRFSLLDAFTVVLTLLLFIMVAAYLGTVASRRIMAATQVSIGVRVGVVKVMRFALILLAALLALNTVGVDFAALTVFGGALGVGLGFGLQRIAANFISGFILIGDRSIRQGDVITIGDRFGIVKELRARYIVVRDRDGVDTLIPNENVITSDVINWSYEDRAVRLKLPVQVSYGDNPRKALELLLAAAAKHPRVQKFPAPASRLMSFGDNGINLELRFWIRDPEDGVNNVRSDLYLEIWDLFQAAGITIPFPQRDLHLRDGWPQGATRIQEVG